MAKFLDSRRRLVTLADVRFCQGGKLLGGDLLTRRSKSAARCWRVGSDRIRACDLVRTLHQPTELRRWNAGVLQDLRQELRPEPARRAAGAVSVDHPAICATVSSDTGTAADLEAFSYLYDHGRRDLPTELARRK